MPSLRRIRFAGIDDAESPPPLSPAEAAKLPVIKYSVDPAEDGRAMRTIYRFTMRSARPPPRKKNKGKNLEAHPAKYRERDRARAMDFGEELIWTALRRSS